MKIYVYWNFGAVVLVISALMLAVVYANVGDGGIKLVCILVGWLAVMFALVAWDEIAGINIIERKINSIEEKLKAIEDKLDSGR